MKYLICLIAFLVSNLTTSQTKLDSLVFNKLNHYRHSIGLLELEWSPIAFRSANNQSSYLSNHSNSDRIICGHNQVTVGYETIDKRYSKFGGEAKVILSEVCNFITFDRKQLDINFYEMIADNIIKEFINSPDHNQAIINDKLKFTGVSCQYKVESNGFKPGTKYHLMRYSIHTSIVFTD